MSIKKILTSFLLLIVCFGVAGCDNKQDNNKQNDQVIEGNNVKNDELEKLKIKHDEIVNNLIKENNICENQINRLKDDIEVLKENNAKKTEHFTYSDGGNNYPYKIQKFKILEEFNANELAEQSMECNTDRDVEYFKELLSNYSSEDIGSKYVFSGWTITVIPNREGNYYTEEIFINDFSQCFAGGDKYPKLLSDKYLLFVSSGCGGAVFDSESEKICKETGDIIENIEPTIKLK